MALCRRVIVRGQRDEPLERVALQVWGRIAYLANPRQLDAVMAGEKRPAVAPLEDLFLFDEAIYALLIEQWMGQGPLIPKHGSNRSPISDLAPIAEDQLQ